MGFNVNMASILGLPTNVQCPKCHKDVHAYFDDLDLDTERVNPKPGVLQLTASCAGCDYEMTVRAILSHTLKIF